MESVMKKIQDFRKNENVVKSVSDITEMFIDGCHVKVRFAKTDDVKVIQSVKSMLISAHINSAFSSSAGGEFA